jgi:hypothetical protein
MSQCDFFAIKMEIQRDDLYFDGPGRYLIHIKENMGQDIFEMFAIKYAQDDPTNLNKKRNQLMIDIKDQSELLGFLNELYNHHYTLIKVEYISISKSNQEMIEL